MIKVLAVVGATASGKSNLAMELATQYNGELVSCDSVQIYKHFDIGSAKPSKEDRQKVPHHLVDCLDPQEVCNAGMWKDLAIQAVEDIHNRGKLPIIVGGTGLYLKALYLGMFEQHSRDEEFRQHLQELATSKGLDFLYQELISKDPLYAQKIASTDSLRIIRALEAIHVTKIPFSELHTFNTKPHWQWIITQPDTNRDVIYARIEQRIYDMLDMGLITETQQIIKQHGTTSPVFNTIGYRHVLQYLTNEVTLDEMIQKLIIDTKHFAKRQQTLFRSLFKEITIINHEEILDKDRFYENI